MKESRIKKIFEILTNDYNTYTAEELANKINFSSKTVRKDIQELNNLIFEKGAFIESKSGVGFKFVISDKTKFSKFIQDEWPKYAIKNSFSSQEYRVNYIILHLLKSSNYTKSEQFLDTLFISRSLLNQDLKLVREILAENRIEIISKPHHGMKIKACEIDIRSFLVNYIEESSKKNKNILQEITGIEYSKINKLSTFVLNQFREFGFDTNLVKYNNFINYLIISIFRMQKGFYISNNNKDNPIYEKYSSIYKLSLSISSEVKKVFNVCLDDKEIEYLYINLLSKIDSYTPSEYNENIEQIIERSLMAIRNTLSIDLSNDSDLKSSLMIHLAPMIKRIKYGINLKNPLLEDIKKDHIAIECAKLCSSYITEFYKIKTNADELGYIALHFSAALAKSRDNLSKKNILLICASGRATAKVLKYRFMHEFSKYINNLDVSDYLMAISMDLNSYDLIVSTIPIKLNTEIPVVEVSAYLYNKDIDKILKTLKGKESINEIKYLFNKDLFFKAENEKILNRDEVLNEMIEKNKKILDKKNYFSELMNRENLASTGLENKVAIPHPLNPVEDDNFIGLYISNNGIDWNGVLVNIVFLLNINDNVNRSTIESFFKYFSEFLNDDKKIFNAIKTNNLKEFWEIFFQTKTDLQ